MTDDSIIICPMPTERVNGKMTPWGAFAQQRRDARKRGIVFNFEFEQWENWWEINLGPNWFTLRGHRKGQYVMARLGDVGAYHPDNVKCITAEENHHEANIGVPRPKSAAQAFKLGKANKGRILTDEHKQKISDGLKGKRLGIKFTEEHKLAISKARKGIKYPPRGPEYSKKMSEIQRRLWAKRKCQ